MRVSVPKAQAPRLARCLLNNEMIEVLSCKVESNKVVYHVEAPEFFEFPNWVTVQ